HRATLVHFAIKQRIASLKAKQLMQSHLAPVKGGYSCSTKPTKQGQQAALVAQRLLSRHVQQ
ncbi:MAG: hypothetical protein AAGA45_08335, partial [Verrucomicrobiota bacterium]